MSETILIKYTADTKEVEKALKDINAQYELIEKDSKKATDTATKGMDNMSKSADGLSSDFKQLAVTIASAFAIQQIVSFGKELNNLGIQLETTGKRMEVVFGNARGIVESEAKKMASALGLSVSQFELMATKAGDILVPLGVARNESAKMSTEIVKLAGALAEFSAGQVTTEQAVHAVTSALTGEREMLKTLGVVLKEEDIKTRLLAKGQQFLEGTALSTAKAVATLELVSEKSADAQQFFAENANSSARANAELTARIQTLREEMAKKLVPIFNQITKRMVEFFESIKITDITDLARGIGALATGFIAYRVAVKSASIATAVMTTGVRGLMGALNPVSGLIGLVTGGMTALGLFNSESRKAERQMVQYQQAVEDATTAQRAFNDELFLGLSDIENSIRKQIQLARVQGKSQKEINAIITEGTEDLMMHNDVALMQLDNQTIGYRDLIKEIDRLKKARKDAQSIRTGAPGENTVMADMKAQKKATEEIDAQMFKLIQKGAEQLGLTAGLTTEYQLVTQLQTRININEKERNKLLDQQKRLVEDKTLAEAEAERQLSEEEKKLRDKEKRERERAEAQRIAKQQKEHGEYLKRLDETKKAEFEALKETELNRKTIIENEVTDLKDKKLSMLMVELDYLVQLKQLQSDYGESTAQTELAMAQKTTDIRKTVTDNMMMEMATTEEIMGDFVFKEVKNFELLSQEGLQFVSNMANAVVGAMQSIAGESMELAIFEVLLNKAIAISQIFAKSQTGEPISTAVKIGLLIGQLLTGFAQINSIISQAQQSKKQNSNTPRFAKGGIDIGGDGSSTGDGLLVRISPRESIINAESTRQYKPALVAINDGTFDNFVNERYIQPAMAHTQIPIVNVDGLFDDERLLNMQSKINKAESKRHKELLHAINGGSRVMRGRKNWY